MDLGIIWDQVRAALGLDEPHAGRTVSTGIQVLVVVTLTIGFAHWVTQQISRAAKSGRVYAEVAALTSRAAALAIYALGVTVVLAVLGANWTAIAAILGAATFGISLALQDVGRSFVNGVYILIERPFRIGDRVRIGESEGRVEDVGVRLTTLRGPAGDRIIVPNTVVFSSVIENTTVGSLDRRRFEVNGVERPVAEISDAVTQSLKGMPHLSHRTPIVDIVQSNPDGTNIQVTVEHDHAGRIDDQVVARLRDLFPEASVATTAAPA